MTNEVRGAKENVYLAALRVEESAHSLFLSQPNPHVACILIARDNSIVGQGHTQHVGGPHAEVMALRDAVARGNSVEGATAYVTLEPCCHHGRTPPCCDELIAAGIKKWWLPLKTLTHS